MKNLNIQIESIQVTAKPRRIGRRTVRRRGKKMVYYIQWMLEPPEHLDAHHDLELGDELEKALTGILRIANAQ